MASKITARTLREIKPFANVTTMGICRCYARFSLASRGCRVNNGHCQHEGRSGRTEKEGGWKKNGELLVAAVRPNVSG